MLQQLETRNARGISMNILVVDDESATRRLICHVLKQAGYTTIQAYDGRHAITIIQADPPQLVLLDVGMPTIDGFEACRAIRQISNVPIMFISARTHVTDRVHGLRIGGDDYLIKPFEPEELLARVAALLRRSQRALGPHHSYRLGGFALDPIAQAVILHDNRQLSLTPIEFRLLHYLMQHAGDIITPEQILDHVWGYENENDRNLVAVYIRRLRSKIEPIKATPRHITTVANIGYRFELRD
ncbi:MAG: response regulator transcription factor [Roseiflexaceae bacterium]